MTKNDSYHTIPGQAIGEFRDRGSKFIAFAYPLQSTDDWQGCLLEVKKLHPKARHWCYAYRIGMDKNNFRMNDDGEPSGSAGRPILGQIDSFGLTNVFVVVVRYFGGTLLGVPGLINAYKTSTASALSNAGKIEKIVQDVFEIKFDYGLMSKVMSATSKLPMDIIAQNFEITASLTVGIRKSFTEDTMQRFKAIVAEVYLEQVADLKKIEGLEIIHIGEK